MITWLVHVGLVQVGLVHVGLVQVGLVHVGLVQVGLVHVGLVQVGLVHVGLVQVGLVHVGLVHVGFSRLLLKLGSLSTRLDGISGYGYVTLLAGVGLPGSNTGRSVKSASWLSSFNACTGACGSGATIARLLKPPGIGAQGADACVQLSIGMSVPSLAKARTSSPATMTGAVEFLRTNTVRTAPEAYGTSTKIVFTTGFACRP